MPAGSWKGSQTADEERDGLGWGARGGGSNHGADAAASPPQAVGPARSRGRLCQVMWCTCCICKEGVRRKRQEDMGGVGFEPWYKCCSFTSASTEKLCQVMSHACVLGDGQEKRHQVMSHTCVLGDGQEKRHQVMSHLCIRDGQGKRHQVMSHTCVLVDGQEKRNEVMSHLCVRGWSREEG